MANLRFLHVVVPQGNEANKKMESKFQELLINLRNTVTGQRISLELYGYAQYTYFFIVMDEHLFETIEGLIYAVFPAAEIKETTDYTLNFDPKKQHLAGAVMGYHHSDVYPIMTFDLFEADRCSRLLSVLSNI